MGRTVADRRVNARQAREWATARNTKRVRRTAAELRERILATAVEMLTKSGGLTVSLAHLNMEELIRIADVPRSSVYRAWESKEAFQVDLMERIIQPAEDHGGLYDPETLQVAAEVLQEHADRLGTAEGRRSVLREMIRQGVAHNFESVARSLAWRSSSALAATLPALDDTDQQRLLTALRQSEARFIDRMSDFYLAMLPILGMRMKAGFDVKVFAATGSAVVEGLIRRSLTNPELVSPSILQPGLDDEPVEWQLAAVGFMGIVDVMLEPDPDFDASGAQPESALERMEQLGTE